MKLFKYTEKELRAAVKSSHSIRETLGKLNVIPAGGNYATFKKAISYFNIDTSHFRGKGWSINKTFQPKRALSVYLNNEFPIQSNKLRQRLIKEEVFDAKCSQCELTSWQDKPIPLELDHVDGNRLDNSLSNLRLLCPNCHAQTNTYRGRNIGRSA